ncbi:MAG: tyrosine-type recombinase/integrase, partial [Myxococcota bacterium]
MRLSARKLRGAFDHVADRGYQPRKKRLHSNKESFTTLHTHFLRSLQSQDYSQATIASYAVDLQLFGSWLQQHNLAALHLSDTDLIEYKNFVRFKQHRQPATINRYFATLRRFYHWLQRMDYLATPPCMPRCLAQPSGAVRWLSASEQRRLLRVTKQQPHQRNSAVIVLLLHTGLRASELCALQWRDICMTQRSGSLYVRQGKGQRERRLPLNTSARTAMQQLGYEHHAHSSELLLQGQRGALVARSLQRIVTHCGRQADITQLSPHRLRHTFCKNLIDAGVGLEVVARLAGHANIQTTRRYCEPGWQDLTAGVAML